MPTPAARLKLFLDEFHTFTSPFPVALGGVVCKNEKGIGSIVRGLKQTSIEIVMNSDRASIWNEAIKSSRKNEVTFLIIKSVPSWLWSDLQMLSQENPTAMAAKELQDDAFSKIPPQGKFVCVMDVETYAEAPIECFSAVCQLLG